MATIALAPSVVVAQQPAAPPTPTAPVVSAPTQADVDRLSAEVFTLRARLADTARRFAEEKSAFGSCMARQATDELEGLKREVPTLSAGVRGLLGLPADPPASAAPAPADNAAKSTTPPK